MTQEEFKKNLESIVNEFGNFSKEYGIRMESVLNELAHINEKPKPFGRWKPGREGQFYYCINGNDLPGNIQEYTFRDDNFDRFVVSMGLAFQTHEECAKWIERRKIEVAFIDFADEKNGREVVPGDDYYTLYWFGRPGRVFSMKRSASHHWTSEIKFLSMPEHDVVQHFGEEKIKLMLGVK